MQRLQVQPRANLMRRAAETGFELTSIDGEVYWDESACYGFSLAEIENDIEGPTAELAAMCLELVGRAARDQQVLERLRIPQHGWRLIAESWQRGDKSLYGRFDLAYDGRGAAKLLEYNADTPTALFEAAVFQWVWLEDALRDRVLPAGTDQFNSIHEKLIARLGAIVRDASGPRRLHLACMTESAEDRGFIAYLEDCARQAGLDTVKLAMRDIGNTNRGPFLDLKNKPIQRLFKLYPWEWMLADAFGRSVSMRETVFIEPPWKMILSNKGILPLLWEMAPGHPNLLEAYFDEPDARARLGHSYALKPLYSREGANVSLVEAGAVVDSDGGRYGKEGFVVQALARLPCFAGRYPVVGSWIVGEDACGIGLREDFSPITKNTSRFVPHVILP